MLHMYRAIDEEIHILRPPSNPDEVPSLLATVRVYHLQKNFAVTLHITVGDEPTKTVKLLKSQRHEIFEGADLHVKTIGKVNCKLNVSAPDLTISRPDYML